MSSRRVYSLLRSTEQIYSVSRRVHPQGNASMCHECRTALKTHNRISSTRAFSTSLQHYKKSSASKKSSKQSPEVKSPNVSEHIPDNKATRDRDADIDPYDFSELDTAITQIIARLKDALSKTRDAGRVTSTMIEALPVQLNIKHPEQSQPKGRGEGPHHEHTRLGDIASVVPKGGRTMQVFAAEESHVKPLMSALQASEHSLTPEVDKQNPLLLVIPVPPATAETRAQAAVEAKKCFDKASLDVRNARGNAQKKHRKMELQKLVIQDELRKAHKAMEDVAKKGQDEVKKIYDGALKALQQ